MSEIDENENEFRDIPNFEGYYQINRLGVVKSLERYDASGNLRKEKYLIPNVDKYGYNNITLSKFCKKHYYSIHTLVYRTFVGEYDNKYFQIDHIDKNKQNNCLCTNLRLVSNRNNMNNLIKQSLEGCGVSKKLNKYYSHIHINNKLIHLGTFESQGDAQQKYLSIKSKIEEIEKITRNYDFKRTKIGYEYFIEFFPIL